MRRILCLLLAVLMLAMIPVSAMAAVRPSAGDDGRPPFTPPSRPTSPNNSDNPRTGDMIMRYMGILIFSVLALAAVVIIYRKKFC